MDIIYVASTCTPQKYYEYVEKQGKRVSQQAQKYNYLLADGFVKNGAKVTLLSSRPMNRDLSHKFWFKGERKTDKNGVQFYYLPFINFPGMRSLFLFFGMFFKILFAKGKPEIICDALNIVSALAVIMVSKIRNLHTIGIVTDVPCHRPNQGKPSMHERMNLWIMKRFSAYLLLTEQMNEIVNTKKHPYIVLEGHADESMAAVENALVNKYDKKVCIYAGTLRSIYGIEYLVKGFIVANIPDTELHIYGNGDFAQKLKEYTKEYPNILYFGVAPNEEVVKEEIKATLLINPRPTHEEYTKYSFPSKNMEYMASGTPVLTTRLPGMPRQYEPYVYLINDESVDGVKKALEEVFSNSRQELHKRGMLAKKFILDEKNNRVQAKKVIDVLMKNYSGRE